MAEFSLPASLKIATGKTRPAPPDAKNVRAFKADDGKTPSHQPRQPRCFLMLHPLRGGWRSSEPAGTHARSHRGPSAAAPPPPVRCERNRPASSISQTWYAWPTTILHLGAIGSRYHSGRRRNRTPRPSPELVAPSLMNSTPAASSAAMTLVRLSITPRTVPLLASIL